MILKQKWCPESMKIEPKSDQNRRKMYTDIQWNVDRHQDNQKIEKMSDPSAMTISDGTSGRQLSGPDGRGKGGRGEGKWDVPAECLTRPGQWPGEFYRMADANYIFQKMAGSLDCKFKQSANVSKSMKMKSQKL